MNTFADQDFSPINVWMFSGQGSQTVDMGRALYVDEPVFRKQFDAFDAIVFRKTNLSLTDTLCYGENSNTAFFENTLITHPALFAVQYSLAVTLLNKGVKPDIVLGTSLGDFVAAAVAGVASPQEVIELLIEQAMLLKRVCKPGFMSTVFAPVSLYDRLTALNTHSDLVGVNYDEHFVVAGNFIDLPRVETTLMREEITFYRLSVEFGFHSRNLKPAASLLRSLDIRLLANQPKLPWVSCAAGGLVENVSQNFFAEATLSPIRFQEAVASITSRAPGSRLRWIDLGPSGTLANFIRRLRLGDQDVHAIMGRSVDTRCAMQRIVSKNSKFNRSISTLSSVTSVPSIKLRQENRSMKAYMFPGQGSQVQGMGAELFQRFPEYVQKANQILNYDLKALCRDNPDNKLQRTEYTQPAIYVTNALAYLAKCEDSSSMPAYLAGHSLGEYCALFASGALSFEDGLSLVKKRGELMSQAPSGAMAAVLGLTEEQVIKLLQMPGLDGIDVANFNAPTQIVISGPVDEIQRGQNIFEEGGCFAYVILPVSGAFHSRMMRDAQQEFASFIEQYEICYPKIPVVANISARPYLPGQIRAGLVDQIASPVRWTDSIEYLADQGIDEFVEVGVGTVLTDLLRKILPGESKVPSSSVKPKKTKQPPEETEVRTVVKQYEAQSSGITVDRLGSHQFKQSYGLRYPYIAGGMVHGIASVEMVVTMAKAGMLGFFGTGGLSIAEIEDAIHTIRGAVSPSETYGMNLLPGQLEEDTINLYLRKGVTHIEAASYMHISPALARYKLVGLKRGHDGSPLASNRILAKISRPEVANAFLSPIPEQLLQRFLQAGTISPEQAEMARTIPVADALCVEADSGGHTDMGVMTALFPAIQVLRSGMKQKHGYRKQVALGLAGGIGTPEAAAAAFILGADFILTGSINQCSVESGMSEVVKDMLQQINVQDTGYAPAGDMFEMGAKVQVLKRGVFFQARANKLYDLYKQYDSVDELPVATRRQLEEKYFGKSIGQVYEECRRYYAPAEIERAENSGKQKLALIFRWYFGYATRLALDGDEGQKVNFQVQCGPALGAFNQWVKNSELENWRNRHVDGMAIKILEGAAELLTQRLNSLMPLPGERMRQAVNA